MHFAAAADVDRAGEISAFHSTGDHRLQRGDEGNKKQEDASAEEHDATSKHPCPPRLQRLTTRPLT